MDHATPGSATPSPHASQRPSAPPSVLSNYVTPPPPPISLSTPTSLRPWHPNLISHLGGCDSFSAPTYGVTIDLDQSPTDNSTSSTTSATSSSGSTSSSTSSTTTVTSSSTGKSTSTNSALCSSATSSSKCAVMLGNKYSCGTCHAPVERHNVSHYRKAQKPNGQLSHLNAVENGYHIHEWHGTYICRPCPGFAECYNHQRRAKLHKQEIQSSDSDPSEDEKEPHKKRSHVDKEKRNKKLSDHKVKKRYKACKARVQQLIERRCASSDKALARIVDENLSKYGSSSASESSSYDSSSESDSKKEKSKKRAQRREQKIANESKALKQTMKTIRQTGTSMLCSLILLIIY
ncbi:hypothetical protein Pelo_18083 [Pelomyxa schiedti]|nr:hypothetical protein Pelo_18083 [Pelomyxa schiedti]